ncbi:hypothetical protein DMENIID0001_054190 [Sergentomyia squamirostris]
MMSAFVHICKDFSHYWPGFPAGDERNLREGFTEIVSRHLNSLRKGFWSENAEERQRKHMMSAFVHICKDFSHYWPGFPAGDERNLREGFTEIVSRHLNSLRKGFWSENAEERQRKHMMSAFVHICKDFSHYWPGFPAGDERNLREGFTEIVSRHLNSLRKGFWSENAEERQRKHMMSAFVHICKDFSHYWPGFPAGDERNLREGFTEIVSRHLNSLRKGFWSENAEERQRKHMMSAFVHICKDFSHYWPGFPAGDERNLREGFTEIVSRHLNSLRKGFWSENAEERQRKHMMSAFVHICKDFSHYWPGFPAGDERNLREGFTEIVSRHLNSLRKGFWSENAEERQRKHMMSAFVHICKDFSHYWPGFPAGDERNLREGFTEIVSRHLNSLRKGFWSENAEERQRKHMMSAFVHICKDFSHYWPGFPAGDERNLREGFTEIVSRHLNSLRKGFWSENAEERQRKHMMSAFMAEGIDMEQVLFLHDDMNVFHKESILVLCTLHHVWHLAQSFDFLLVLTQHFLIVHTRLIADLIVELLDVLHFSRHPD